MYLLQPLYNIYIFILYQLNFAAYVCVQVMVDVDDKNEWKECIDIGGVRLPTGYFFGASAATGDLSGNSGTVKYGKKDLN